MHLAPDFPDDPAMRQLMELLHEEIGLPERKTIHLDTAINLDLGCDGADARHLMEAFEERFAVYLIDYDAYRYFQPEGFDVFQKRRAKGRGKKVPLTIGMLYKAIKTRRWDTQEGEGI
jgi:broad specificity phosphatase PhoE